MSLPNHITLRPGDQGEYVLTLQHMLGARGFFSRTQVSGYYDEYTVKAVVRFQGAHRLLMDGIAGPQTIRVLNGFLPEETSDNAAAYNPWGTALAAAAGIAVADALRDAEEAKLADAAALEGNTARSTQQTVNAQANAERLNVQDTRAMAAELRLPGREAALRDNVQRDNVQRGEGIGRDGAPLREGGRELLAEGRARAGGLRAEELQALIQHRLPPEALMAGRIPQAANAAAAVGGVIDPKLLAAALAAAATVAGGAEAGKPTAGALAAANTALAANVGAANPGAVNPGMVDAARNAAAMGQNAANTLASNTVASNTLAANTVANNAGALAQAGAVQAGQGAIVQGGMAQGGMAQGGSAPPPPNAPVSAAPPAADKPTAGAEKPGNAANPATPPATDPARDPVRAPAKPAEPAADAAPKEPVKAPAAPPALATPGDATTGRANKDVDISDTQKGAVGRIGATIRGQGGAISPLPEGGRERELQPDATPVTALPTRDRGAESLPPRPSPSNK